MSNPDPRGLNKSRHYRPLHLLHVQAASETSSIPWIFGILDLVLRVPYPLPELWFEFVSGKQVSKLGHQKGLELTLKMFSWSGGRLNLDLAWGQYLSISVLLLQY
jgi:hypothetical protein